MVVLNIPHGVRVPDSRVTAHLSLLKAPLRKGLGGASQDALDKIVMKLDFCGHMTQFDKSDWLAGIVLSRDIT